MTSDEVIKVIEETIKAYSTFGAMYPIEQDAIIEALAIVKDKTDWRMKWSEEHDKRVRLEEQVKRLRGEVETWKAIANDDKDEK